MFELHYRGTDPDRATSEYPYSHADTFPARRGLSPDFPCIISPVSAGLDCVITFGKRFCSRLSARLQFQFSTPASFPVSSHSKSSAETKLETVESLPLYVGGSRNKVERSVFGALLVYCFPEPEASSSILHVAACNFPYWLNATLSHGCRSWKLSFILPRLENVVPHTSWLFH